MENFKEIAADPKKLEEHLKKAFETMDKEKKGYITNEQLQEAIMNQAKVLKIEPKQPTPEEMAEAKKIIDPEGNGQIKYENFKKVVEMKVAKAKAEGKL